MKASSRIFAACVGLSWLLAPGGARADWRSGAVRWVQLTAPVGQSAPAASSPQEARRQVADLLERARQAMKDGRLETADSLISRAEGFNVPFGALHMGDTPKKARRDLSRMRGANAAGPQRPSDLFAPQTNEPQARSQASEPAAESAGGVEDPFAQRPAAFEPRMDRPAPAGFGASDPRLIDAPPEDEPPAGGLPRQAFPQESPFGKQAALAPPESDESEPGITAQGYRSQRAPTADQMLRTESDKLLIAARRSLAVGDVRRATDLVNQAKALQAPYEYQDDSPAKVEAAVQRFAELGDPRANKNSELYRRRRADSLLEQSEGLLYWQELDEAERLVNDAKRLNVPYSPVDANPDMLLERIAAARQGRSANGIEPLPPVDATGAAAANDDDAVAREQALRLVAGARAAMQSGDLDRAEALAEQAEELHVPDAAFQGRPQQDRPWNVLLDIQQMRRQQRGGVRQAGGVMPIGAESQSGGHTATQALYDRANDRTRNVPAGARLPQDTGDDAQTLFDRGEAALKQHDTETALHWFREANQHRGDLDAATQQRLQDRLQFLSQPRQAQAPGGDGALLHETAAEQQRKYRTIATELDRKERAADRVRADNPKQAAELLEECRALVEKSDLNSTARGVLMRRVERKLEDLEKYVQANRGKIELNERNNAVRTEIERERQTKIEVQDKLAQLVDEFNKLMHENRFAEAEVVYKKAAELAPDELVVTQLKNTVKMVARTKNNAALREAKENGVFAALEAVEQSIIPIDDRKPYQFGPVKDWKEMTKRRSELLREARSRRSERDVEIEKRLTTPVSLKYREAPLSQVIEDLGKLANINVYLDARGLGEEAVDTNTPVTIDLSQDISLKSALQLILEPLHLSYVVKNEVLMITSAQLRDGEVFAKTYNVADLVTPIPNFVPNERWGLAGALHEAQANLPMNWGGMNADAPTPVFAGAESNTMLSPQALAQINAANSAAITPTSGAKLAGVGPGGAAGGTAPDFDTLIELITSTIAPTTWDDVGGPGTVTPFQGNLSLVISQTQEVHEEIADLLEQLRRLQDLQVTIEVRFITLNDNYFERIGVNFDFEIPTYLNKPFQLFGRELGDTVVPNSPSVPAFPPPYTNNDVSPINLRKNQGVTVGLQPSPTGGVLYSSDLDIPFQQGSFGLATPQFGGYQAGAGATIGFAILSQIEAYLLIEASQGDRRSNVLQAPKVTLFNGQAAVVADTTATPFVVSVIPVVGAFAAAQMPVIMVLNEGTSMTVQAVVSNDRRFVRLTLIPFFSNIGMVNTFTFTGSSSTTQNSDSEGPSDNTTKRVSSTTTSAEGTTVQLPSFSFFTVATTVSVPDGGTVLLGGVKRLSEGRNEFGVPLLSKIPYVNRLFRNVGIGRETQSLMMMVTPRIIIQEEEEAMLGIPPTP
ncbi:MAG TPA: hypothetical protein VF306_08065 [Pirellulales bacterium]